MLKQPFLFKAISAFSHFSWVMWAERALKIKHVFHQVCRSRASSVLFWDMGEDSQIWPRLRFCTLDTDTRAMGAGLLYFQGKSCTDIHSSMNISSALQGKTHFNTLNFVFLRTSRPSFSCSVKICESIFCAEWKYVSKREFLTRNNNPRWKQSMHPQDFELENRRTRWVAQTFVQ